MSDDEKLVLSASALRAAAFDCISDGVVVCNSAGVVLLANRALRTLLELAPDALLPAHISDLPLRRTDMHHDQLGLQADNSDYILDNRTLRATTSALLNEAGDAIGSVIMLHDISAEVAARDDVMRFIAGMSHELGKPLTPISGNLDLLLRGYIGPLDDEQKVIIQQARHWVGRLNTAVRNTVAVASIEAHQVQPDPQPLALRIAVEGVLSSLKQSFAAKGIDVQISLPADLPNVLADNTKRQILTQLLDNARRFTKDGLVTISAHPSDGMVQIEVADTGIGIQPEEQANLFSRFHWILKGNNAERGSGLGLYIARQLVEHQGGRIWLACSSDEGSVFCFVLPQAVAENTDLI